MIRKSQMRKENIQSLFYQGLDEKPKTISYENHWQKRLDNLVSLIIEV